MPQGTVRWFDPERGFGFLAPADGAAEVFVHASEVVGAGGPGGAVALREGQAVEFDVGEGERGPQARHVVVTSDVAPDAPLGQLGTVAWYEPGKGYGFVVPDDGGAEIFLHSSAIVAGGVVVEGQRVAFLVGEGDKGPQAGHVLPLAAGTAPPAAPPPRAAAGDGADGTVSWFDADKGFGFVTPDQAGEDVFVHVRALAGGLGVLSEGDRVTYDVVRGDKGPQAREVRLARGTAGRGGSGSSGPARTSSPSSRASSGPASRPSSATSRRPVHPGVGDAPSRGGEGVVARYDAERGFGFITPDGGGADLFVHVSVLGGADGLHEGDRVRFTVRQSDRGPQADRVERL